MESDLISNSMARAAWGAAEAELACEAGARPGWEHDWARRLGEAKSDFELLQLAEATRMMGLGASMKALSPGIASMLRVGFMGASRQSLVADSLDDTLGALETARLDFSPARWCLAKPYMQALLEFESGAGAPPSASSAHGVSGHDPIFMLACLARCAGAPGGFGRGALPASAWAFCGWLISNCESSLSMAQEARAIGNNYASIVPETFIGPARAAWQRWQIEQGCPQSAPARPMAKSL